MTALPPDTASAVESAASTSVSVPGAAGISRPPSLRSPPVANGAMATIAARFLRNALRSRRKTIGDSSSGSKPTRSTWAAFSRSAYAVAPPSGVLATTWAARKSASSAECGRARKSIALVPRAIRANFA